MLPKQIYSTFSDHMTEQIHPEQYSVPTRRFLQRCPDQKQNLFQSPNPNQLQREKKKKQTTQHVSLFSITFSQIPAWLLVLNGKGEKVPERSAFNYWSACEVRRVETVGVESDPTRQGGMWLQLRAETPHCRVPQQNTTFPVKSPNIYLLFSAWRNNDDRKKSLTK